MEQEGGLDGAGLPESLIGRQDNGLCPHVRPVSRTVLMTSNALIRPWKGIRGNKGPGRFSSVLGGTEDAAARAGWENRTTLRWSNVAFPVSASPIRLGS